jgi:uncharacterized MAPEG superfamily protein
LHNCSLTPSFEETFLTQSNNIPPPKETFLTQSKKKKMQAMQIVQNLPPYIRKPLMQVAMKAMQNPTEAIKRATIATLPINLILIFCPHFFKMLLVRKSGTLYDNADPRGLQNKKSLEKSTYSRIISRCSSAHLNTLETFPLFGIALLACMRSHPKTNGKQQLMVMLKLALKYTAGRAFYIMLYICSGDSQIMGGCRTAAYFQNIFCIFQLFRLSITAPMR